MNVSVESESTRQRRAACPMLMECDLLGRVLWMNSPARLELRNPERLSDAIIRRNPDPHAVHKIEVAALQFWWVWESPTSVLIGAQAVEGELEETKDLLVLQNRVTGHFLQLLGLERRLFVTAQQRRGRGGRKAVRQIEMERQRLGRELHTGVGQMLSAIRLQLEVIARELPSPPNTVAQALSRISILAAQTLEQVRGISQRLHPPDWQRLTLESALRQLWEISGIPERFQAVLHIDPLPSEPELEVKTLIYRAFQEALSNLARHSGASRIEAALWWHGETLTLSIRDNGVGFDVARTLTSPASVAAGIGLRSIREATEGLDGKFYVTSGPDGTILEVSVAFAPVQR